MIRKIPENKYIGLPCSVVAVSCAKGELIMATTRADGWMSLQGMNKFVRNNFQVKKYQYYKRGERTKLKDYNFTGKAIAIVLGHCIYVNGNSYYSFFDNADDDVVAVWFI
jgi:hypothetical protein